MNQNSDACVTMSCVIISLPHRPPLLQVWSGAEEIGLCPSLETSVGVTDSFYFGYSVAQVPTHVTLFKNEQMKPVPPRDSKLRTKK